MQFMKSLKALIEDLLSIPEERSSPERYRIVGRNIAILMLITTILPLSLMTLINYYEYKAALRNEIQAPMKTLVNKVKHSIELFLASRLSTVNFIASAYKYEELADERTAGRANNFSDPDLSGAGCRLGSGKIHKIYAGNDDQKEGDGDLNIDIGDVAVGFDFIVEIGMKVYILEGL